MFCFNEFLIIFFPLQRCAGGSDNCAKKRGDWQLLELNHHMVISSSFFHRVCLSCGLVLVFSIEISFLCI